MRTMLLTLTAALLLSACAATGADTEFRVYDLHGMFGGEVADDDGDDDNNDKVFLSMLREAVGPDTWFRTNSSMFLLDGVLTVRTTEDGHAALNEFFGRYRSIRALR